MERTAGCAVPCSLEQTTSRAGEQASSSFGLSEAKAGETNKTFVRLYKTIAAFMRSARCLVWGPAGPASDTPRISSPLPIASCVTDNTNPLIPHAGVSGLDSTIPSFGQRSSVPPATVERKYGKTLPAMLLLWPVYLMDRWSPIESITAQ
ncbi:hypothetical protein SKAU_G00135820 [Synaphobranchus kaupii]|uniref:Uncharacterized protein n=1 Tax=Synaphobranchus kaupii TaxID=118154 RepID=A0A9Q1FRA5_SYNKA|nr:hypothetical protein SKAU_G00135820 [Synaphobranchus kaupii]